MKYLLLLLFFSTNVLAESKYSLLVGSGSYQGVMTVGGSWKNDFYGTDVSYGYSPASVVGHDIHQLNAKMFLEKMWSCWERPCYFKTSAGVIYGKHPRLFLRLPDQYPEHYYTPAALRYPLSFDVGVKALNGTIYLNYTYLDSEIFTVYNSSERDLTTIGTYGLSYFYLLK